MPTARVSTAVAVKDADAAADTDAALDLAIVAPMSGTLLPLSEVPDAAFAAGKVGKGAAIDPDGDVVVAPAAGKVMVTFPTGHAVGLKLDNGLQVLVHIGVDTVNMGGEGFEFCAHCHSSGGSKVGSNHRA